MYYMLYKPYFTGMKHCLSPIWPSLPHADVSYSRNIASPGHGPDPDKETETNVVCPRLNVYWFRKANGKENGEEEVGRDKIKQWTEINVASLTRASENRIS